ncbi:acyl-CoA dehydrogenase [Amycolatopsis acidiphila]|uniref:Acyl-CoA dehydrogenase n=1 Tax=Amycolatopsis acidiphila TaxID=715473 RepID=A0A558AEV5_9PSEU|nr:acyl-CoA dehydrogenase [Amycolatopsis acidiphila]TVT22797.1 acyl-CoA dehydrogenase [Amycolatopsis acidiphila]UIJ58190.1 acyl-CoA dehydrogenase [Amycolatopsis acidiphila]GHG69532.1 acyl-CoA dehydrogenase [Amycolatopsis acidiphila]
MAIAVTSEQRAWAESIRARGGDPGELRGVALPEELGGAGGTVTDLAVGLEEAAAALAPGPLLGSVLAGLVLARRPDSALAKELVPALADGSARAAVAFGPGSVVASPTGQGFFLRGRTDPVLDADASAHLVVATDLGWFVLPPQPVEPAEGLDLSRDVGFLDLALEVPRSALLEDAPVLDLAATLTAAEASGIARWCVRTASEYAGVREQFGRPIGSFQAVKHLCAQMLCRSEVAAALAWDAARAGGEHPLAAAVAAAGALDAAVDNAKDCIQVLGGIGFTWEHEAHRYLRRALTLRQLLGGSGRWRRRVAELALSGQRRVLGVDVGEDAQVREMAGEIAALLPERQRARLAETGYLMPHWPKPHGLDADPARQLVIDAELARAGVRRPDLVIGAWAVPTILEHGTPAQRDRFAAPTLRGEITWCQLFSEPEAGSDLAALRTRATKVDGGWALTGQKVWTSLAREADWAICLARTDPDAPKHKGITYFLVDMTAPGIEIRPLREITGDAVFNEVFLDDVFVPDEHVVGEVGGGWRLARTTLANERVAMSGGSSVGEEVEKLLASVEAPDAAVLDRLGALVTDGSACSLLDLRATLRRLDGQDPGPESSVRKLVGVRHRQEVAETALDLLGPAGVTDAAAQHEFLLTRCLSIAGGTTQVLLNVAAERLLGLPR